MLYRLIKIIIYLVSLIILVCCTDKHSSPLNKFSYIEYYYGFNDSFKFEFYPKYYLEFHQDSLIFAKTNATWNGMSNNIEYFSSSINEEVKTIIINIIQKDNYKYTYSHKHVVVGEPTYKFFNFYDANNHPQTIFFDWPNYDSLPNNILRLYNIVDSILKSKSVHKISKFEFTKQTEKTINEFLNNEVSIDTDVLPPVPVPDADYKKKRKIN